MSFENWTIEELFARCTDYDDGSLSMDKEEFAALRRMLQGQPVGNRDELPPGIKSASELDSVAKNAESLPGNSPVIGWLRSDYNSDDKRDPNAPLFMLGSNDPSETWGVKYLPLSGNSPVIPNEMAVSGALDFGEQCYAAGWNKCRMEMINQPSSKK